MEGSVQSISIEKFDCESCMAHLSKALDVCAPVLKGKLLYLDYPVHNNIGDLLIWMGARKFFKRHKKTFIGQYGVNINHINDRLRSFLEESSTICFHGGGNFGDLYPHSQKLREKIIQEYPHKRIVILPQSVHFNNPRELDYACAVFKRHPDLHIFLRDRRSYALLHSNGVPNLELCPDMAHALWGTISAPKPVLHNALYLLRRDEEEGDLPLDIVSERPASMDWDDILTGWTQSVYRMGVRINEVNGRRANNRLPACSIWGAVSRILIKRAVDLFAPYETIVSDRLHAVILASLLNRKSIAFDNSYGKVSSYLDCWMSDMPGIVLQKR